MKIEWSTAIVLIVGISATAGLLYFGKGDVAVLSGILSTVMAGMLPQLAGPKQ
jgi:hypothetical protein